jgi:predicted nucleotidyltransferase
MMTIASTDDPILKRFKAALREIYGDQIERIVLFGSRARGEAQPDSDYDVALFLKQVPDRRKERRRLADLRVDFIDDTGAFFDTKPFSIAAYGDRTPLMSEIRRDGLDL